MALAYVQSNKNADNSGGSSTTITVTLPSVVAGTLVVVGLKYEGATTTSSVSDGTDTFTPRTQISHANGDVHSRWFYLLASGGSGGVMTFTATLGASRPWRGLHVYNFSYTGTAAFDVEPTGGGSQGNGTAATSGTFNTSGTDEVVVAIHGNYTGSVSSNPLVNGAAADGSNSDTIADMSWYKILSATFSGGAATVTVASGDWVVAAAGFKVTGGGGGGGLVSPLIGGRLVGNSALVGRRLIG